MRNIGPVTVGVLVLNAIVFLVNKFVPGVVFFARPGVGARRDCVRHPKIAAAVHLH